MPFPVITTVLVINIDFMLFVLMAIIRINRHNTVKILPFNFLLELERYFTCENIGCGASFKWRMQFI